MIAPLPVDIDVKVFIYHDISDSGFVNSYVYEEPD
jgi:hypothetical protein